MYKTSKISFLLHLALVKVSAGIVNSVLDAALQEKILTN